MFNNNNLGRPALKPKFKQPRLEKKKGADVQGIVEEDHGRYRIKAGRLKGAFVARAFPKPPTKAQGVIAEAKGESEAAAIAALKAIIEARDVQRTEVRRWEERSSVSVPSVEEFVEALQQARLSQAQVTMLKALSIAAEDGLRFAQLANAAGYKSRDTAAMVFQKAGALIADYLAIDISEHDVSKQGGAARLLALRNTLDEDASEAWILHKEVQEAVRLAF